MLSPIREARLAWTNPEPVPPPAQQPATVHHLRLLDPQRYLHPVLTRRDPALVRRYFPVMAKIVDHYFRSEVEGAENLTDKASLITATHNGGMFTPDAYCLAVAFLRRFGLETPAYGLMHKAAFHIPLLGSTLVKMGAIPACPDNARLILKHNFPALVFPGGDMDSLKPFARRHQIEFGHRRGFIRIAISEQVPIVPVVSVGAHETIFVLNDGRRIAQVTGLAKLFRIKSVPLALGFPMGITPAGLGNIPLPAKIKLRILPRIELAERPEAADDPAVVERCFQHVRGQMQAALTELAAERRWPVLG